MMFEHFGIPTMLNDLRIVLKLIAIFKFEKYEFHQPFIYRLVTIPLLFTIMTLFYVGSLMYSVKYHTTLEMFKSMCYSFNSIICTAFVYAYLLTNRNHVEELISAWENTFRNSKFLRRKIYFYWVW